MPTPATMSVYGMNVNTLPRSQRDRTSTYPLMRDMLLGWSKDELAGADSMYQDQFGHGITSIKNPAVLPADEYASQRKIVNGNMRRIAESIPATAPVSTTTRPVGPRSSILFAAYQDLTDRTYMPAYRNGVRTRLSNEDPITPSTLIHESVHANSVQPSLLNPASLALNAKSGTTYPLYSELPAVVEEGVAGAMANPQGQQMFGRDRAWIAQQAAQHGLRPGTGDFMKLYASSPETRQWAKQVARQAYETMNRTSK